MKRLLAFDPGVKHIGWASFEDDKLQRCGLIRDKPELPLPFAVAQRFEGVDLSDTEVLIEKPQVYKQAHWKGDPNDLVDLAIVCGVLGQSCRSGNVRYVRPHDWKGSAKKEAVHGWIYKRLEPDELSQLDVRNVPASLMHNLLDAVGIGLFGAGRLR